MKKVLYPINFNDLTSTIKIGQYTTEETPYSIEILIQNLYVPWALDISDDGDIYFTQRSGSVRVIENGILNPEPLISLETPFSSQGEGGLMGIVLDPDFSMNNYIYIMHTYTENNQIFNRVVRLIVQNNRADTDKIIIDNIPGGRIHNGGRIKIGPDRKLYITTGDAGIQALAQDLTSLAGKILRLELDGSIPDDNPFGDSPVYSYGHRNPQGLAWDTNNTLYASEHGQRAHDEINLIIPGGNYGWPLVQGDEEINNLNLRKPILESENETLAPSGMSFINQGTWNGKLAVATLRGEQLLVVTLNQGGTKVENVESWFLHEFGRIREVVQGNDGSLYLTTSNKDGRGRLYPGDDKIIKLTILM